MGRLIISEEERQVILAKHNLAKMIFESKLQTVSDLQKEIEELEKKIEELKKKGKAKETNEQSDWFNSGPGPGSKKSYTSTRPIKMGGSLFKNGIDKIDLNSSEFQKGLDAIKNATKGNSNLTITVQGGASAVGQNQGYDNMSLAKRRAKNFIDAVKSKFPNATFVEGEPIVGIATKQNSSEANSEQFVRLMFDVEDVQSYQMPAIDNTAARVTNEDEFDDLVNVDIEDEEERDSLEQS